MIERAVVVTNPAGSAPNEDASGVIGQVAVVADGAGIEARYRAGCAHSVAWYSWGLAQSLLRHANAQMPLREALAAAISEMNAAHGTGCDLSQGSPSATVTMVRVTDDEVQYLVLCDSSVIVRMRDGQVERITDDRVEHLQPSIPGPDGVEALRNAPGGFWIARSEAHAAAEALTGSWPRANVERVHLVSDGFTRVLDIPSIERLLATDDCETEGLDAFETSLAADPQHLLRRLRIAEKELPVDVRPRKIHDDATAVSVFPESVL